MASTIKLPGVGPVKSTYVYIGAAGIAGLVAYSYYRASRTEEPETLEEFDEGSELAFGDAMTTDFAPDGSGFGFGWPSPSSPSTVDPDLDRDPITDNEWTSQALEYLTDVGVDRQAASLAISRFRLRDCLSAAQMDIVRQAVGRFGNPPQSPNLTMVQCPSPPTTTPPSTTPPKAGCTGSTSSPAAPKNLRVVSKTRTTVRLDWDPISCPKGYEVFMSGRKQVTVLYSGQWTRSGLKPNSVYKFQVFGIGTNGKRSSGSNIVSVRTAK